MAVSPASGALTQTQLAVLEQIRALRAAKTTASVQAAAPIPSTASVETKPAAAEPTAAQPLTIAASAAGPIPANRPRGSILNITV